MTMRIRDWMSPDPVTVAPEASIREARGLLRQYGVRHLPVVRDGELIGIISDRDVRLDATLLDRLPDDRLVAAVRERRSVESVMSAPVHVIAPDDTIAAAARLMLSRRVRALPVVDDERAVLGAVTSTDCLLALLSPEGPAGQDAVPHRRR